MTDSTQAPNTASLRSWAKLTAAGTAIGLAVAGAGNAAGVGHDANTAPEKLWLVQSEVGADGGGGETTPLVEPSMNFVTVTILTNLGLLDGYLRAGVALYDAGEAEQAAIHIKSPGDDDYAELSKHFEDNGNPDFGPQLTTLDTAISGTKPTAEVASDLKAVQSAMDELRSSLGATNREKAEAILEVIQQAGDRYQDSVINGTLNGQVEYADAWGFVQSARAMAKEMQDSDDAPAKAFGKKVTTEIDMLEPLVPDVTAKGPFPPEAVLFSSVATSIEQAAEGLQ